MSNPSGIPAQFDGKRQLVRYLVLFHIMVIVAANYAVQFTGYVTIAGTSYQFTYAMFVFALVFVATDLTVRLVGQSVARVVCMLACIPAMLVSIVVAGWVGSTQAGDPISLGGILFWGWRIGIASGTAYLVGLLFDITIFHKIRERYSSWWLPPLVSTIIATAIDVYTFFALAFHRSASPLADIWFEVASVDLAFRAVISTLVFLPIYGVLLRYLTQRLATLR